MGLLLLDLLRWLLLLLLWRRWSLLRIRSLLLLRLLLRRLVRVPLLRRSGLLIVHVAHGGGGGECDEPRSDGEVYRLKQQLRQVKVVNGLARARACRRDGVVGVVVAQGTEARRGLARKQRRGWRYFNARHEPAERAAGGRAVEPRSRCATDRRWRARAWTGQNVSEGWAGAWVAREGERGRRGSASSHCRKKVQWIGWLAGE